MHGCKVIQLNSEHIFTLISNPLIGGRLQNTNTDKKIMLSKSDHKKLRTFPQIKMRNRTCS
jgi:hypothetical protein